MIAPDKTPRVPSRTEWRSAIAPYERPNDYIAAAQVFTTVSALLALYYAMYRSLHLPYWITLLIAIPTAAFLVRTFVLMHDCSHGSFFSSRRANEIVGTITGILTLTPFARWRHDHALHHASAGDLGRRGHGDVPTLTVREYLALSAFGRLRYRLFRNPVIIVLLGPILVLMSQRFTRARDHGNLERSVWTANVVAVALLALLSLWVGLLSVAAVFLPVIYVSAVVGVWLFYVQHQFEGTYWADKEQWDFARAALRGSSFFKLPAPLRWVTASIGLHHVHHLGPRIPNYRLQSAHDENPFFHTATTLTFTESMKMLRLSLWDEDRGMLVAFSEIHAAKCDALDTNAA